MKALNSKIGQRLQPLSDLPVLLARLTIGVVFVGSGWGKLHNLESVVSYFTQLGIPFASIQAPFVAAVELIFGGLVAIGLLSRISTLPLIATMLVAIQLAKMPELQVWTELFGYSEFLYLILLVWIFIEGPKRISIDYLFSKLK